MVQNNTNNILLHNIMLIQGIFFPLFLNIKEFYLSRARELFKLNNLHSAARGHALVDFILQGHEQNES